MKPGTSLKRGYVLVPDAIQPLPETGPVLLPQHRTIFLNRMGGEYLSGTDNSTVNRSSVITYYDSPGGTLSPYPYDDASWDQVLGCVRERYGAFNVTVTDQDPGAASHIEIAVAGRPEEIGLPEGCCLGVAPFACSPIDNAVTYAFAGVHTNSVEDLCWTILQETAHALGLDHELLCADPMTYLYGCGVRKEFTDELALCGEEEGMSRECTCGGATQNSVALLRQALGDSPDASAPEVRITWPADGAVLGPGFDVHADAADDVAVMRVDLSIDGAVQATDTAAPYTFTTSDALPEGPHDVEVRAYDARGNVELYAIRVNVSFAADPDGDGWGGGGQAGESVVIGGCAAASGRDADARTGFLALLFASLAYTLRRVVTMATRRRRRRYH